MKDVKSGSGADSSSDQSGGIVSAVAILKRKYPGQFNKLKNEASKASSRKFFLVSSVVAVIITSAWLKWGQFSFVADYAFIYNTGLAGGLLMLLALMYSLRKRLAVLRNAGKVETWYYVHLCAGIGGPLLIIFHSSFAIKSVNSLIAITAMALIVCSGALGRFLFTRLSFTMHSKLERIDREEAQLFDTLVKYDSKLIRKHLSRLTLTCLTQPKTVFHIPYAYFLVRAQAAASYVAVGDQITKVLVEVAKRSHWDEQTLLVTIHSEKHYLKQYINTLMDVSVVRSYEQLLSKWRMFHAPLMYLLLLCTLAHVWVVHAY
ncbi:hypothetical protein [Kaarinaea lacus]